MKRNKLLVACMLIMSLAFSASAQAADITVSAAASLTNAFTEIKNAFEQKNPGIKVTTNFAASNPLLKQIETGAPVDVFATADQGTMDKAQAQKFLVEASRKSFAANSLVLIIPADGKLVPKNAAELAGSAYSRVSIGNPDSVPAGRYAREVLQHQNLWDKLGGKLIMGESVRQVLDYVVRGEVQAGFVYGTDAKQGGDKVKVIEEMQGKTRVTYPISVLERSKLKKEAQSFVDFVLSPDGQAILAKYGFSRP